MSDDDPREEIERLEAQIDELSARLESCRKFILAGRISIVVGAVLFAALLLQVVRFDPRLVALAVAGVLGGIVAWGANNSTAKEAAAELAAVQAERAALIETIEFRLIPERPTLH